MFLKSFDKSKGIIISADFSGVMKNGQIQEMGESDEVFTNPQSEYTRMLLDAIPRGEV